MRLQRQFVIESSVVWCLVAFVLLPLSSARPATFIRGDVDENGTVQITDGIRILNHLFAGDPSELPCRDAADANDAGDVNISDGVYLLSFLFAGGGPPRASAP